MGARSPRIKRSGTNRRPYRPFFERGFMSHNYSDDGWPMPPAPVIRHGIQEWDPQTETLESLGEKLDVLNKKLDRLAEPGIIHRASADEIKRFGKEVL